MGEGYEFWLEDIEPCTLNTAYETSSAHHKFKSGKTHVWLWTLRKQLLQYKPSINQLKAYWRASEHYLLVNYTHFIPAKKLFVQKNRPKEGVKKGAISKVSRDWSNIPKIPDDLIFNAILGIDDGHICTGVVNKFPSPDDRFYLLLKIQIRTIEELKERAKHALPDHYKNEIATLLRRLY